jgi:hypothetical protein
MRYQLRSSTTNTVSELLTFFPEIDTLIQNRVFVTQLIELEDVEGVQGGDASHDILPHIFSEWNRRQTSFDI